MGGHERQDKTRSRVARVAGACVLGAVILTTNAPTAGPAGAVDESAKSDAIDVALDFFDGAAVADLDAQTRGTTRLSKPAPSEPAPSEPEELELRALSTATSVGGSVTHVYVQQAYGGIDIVGAGASVAVKDGEVVHAPDRLIAPTDLAGLDASSTLDALTAVSMAADALDLSPADSFAILDADDASDSATTVTDGGVAIGPITARKVYVRHDKQIHLAWEVVIDVAGSPDWWQLTIDADTGEELDRFNYNITHSVHVDPHTQHDDHGEEPADLGTGDGATPPSNGGLVADGSSYRVFPGGVESPNHGSRVLLNEPADDVASPFGWHDTNGIAGAEHTDTRGNNVDAFADADGDNQPDPGSRPDGGAGLDFDFALDFGVDPDTQTDASVTQLFVSTNFAHDFLYAYGFDEASGNFQQNNYGRGGVGGDHVLAEAQGTDATNNANFATPREGFTPRMQNFFWPNSSVAIDGAFDQGVVLHEYGHGLSVRLTGGPSNVACLGNFEQAGEGWSDYVALMATMQPGDQGPDRRGIGTYVLRQSTTSRGIRSFPYSTDQGIDPRTYGDIATASVPHGVGSIWAAMLWDMTWGLIDEHGLDSDVVHGNGGNNIAMQLMVDGLKLQPCSPGFVEARDAILQADENLTSGANACTIWSAFAGRGLGLSADQGSADDHTDGVEAFDVPAECSVTASVTTSGNTTTAGSAATVSVKIANNTANVENGLTITVPLPAALDFVTGSAGCGGTEVGSAVRMSVGSIASGGQVTCSFGVIARGAPSTTVLADDFDPNANGWTTSNGIDRFGIGHNATPWSVAVDGGRNGSNAAFATGTHAGASNQQASDMLLTTADDVFVPDGAVLSFWHDFDYESGYDGGVVEISTDGGASWIDLGADMTSNGYVARISGGDRSPIAGRLAFTGTSGGFQKTVVDLCRFSGETIDLRFRSTTDPSITSAGWKIDEVTVSAVPSASIAASVSGTAGPTTSDTTCVAVAESDVAPTSPPRTSPPSTGGSDTVETLGATASAGAPAKRMPAG